MSLAAIFWIFPRAGLAFGGGLSVLGSLTSGRAWTVFAVAVLVSKSIW